MKTRFTVLTLFTLLALSRATLGETKDAGIDTKKIDELTGAKGVLNQEEGVFKVSFPRTDVKVTVDGWAMKPFMGLTSWAAFQKGRRGQMMVMGDLVLFEDEVNPVMSAALDNGLSVTALHNHFFYDSPKVFFMLSVQLRTRSKRFAQPVRNRQRDSRDLPFQKKAPSMARPLKKFSEPRGKLTAGCLRWSLGERPGCTAGTTLEKRWELTPGPLLPGVTRIHLLTEISQS